MNSENEIEIVWLDDPLKYTYLRETTIVTGSPRRFSKNHPGLNVDKLIGYAVHAPGKDYYRRRFWYRSAWDSDCDPAGHYAATHTCPSEAVLPRSVKVGVSSIPYQRGI